MKFSLIKLLNINLTYFLFCLISYLNLVVFCSLCFFIFLFFCVNIAQQSITKYFLLYLINLKIYELYL